MEAVVNQALCDVHRVHAVLLLDGVAKDNFVHGRQRIREREDTLEMLANVVRIQHGVFGCLADARTVRKNVRERAHQHAEVAGERLDSPDRVRPVLFERQLSACFLDKNRDWPERLEDLLHRDGSGAGASAAMRRRERLVQIQMHHVYAKIAGPRYASERIHIRPVHVEQCALRVKNRGNVRDALFEDAQRRWVRDHQCGYIFRHELAQLFGIDLPVRVRLDVFDLVTRDDGCRGIGAVRRVRDQHLFASVPLRFKIRANQQQPG